MKIKKILLTILLGIGVIAMPSLALADFECQICLADCPDNSKINASCCQAEVCKDCVFQNIRTQAREYNIRALNCTNCHQALDLNYLNQVGFGDEQILENDSYDERKRKQSDRELKERIIALNYKRGKAGSERVKIVNADGSKVCPNPKCGMVIYRTEGCKYICCRVCTHEFCWTCLADMPGHISQCNCPLWPANNWFTRFFENNFYINQHGNKLMIALVCALVGGVGYRIYKLKKQDPIIEEN